MCKGWVTYGLFGNCVSNQCIYFYMLTVRCDCKLWNAFWFYCVFWVFSLLTILPFMSELLYLHQTSTNCVSNQYIWYFDMPDATISSPSKLVLWKCQCFWYVILQTFINFLWKVTVVLTNLGTHPLHKSSLEIFFWYIKVKVMSFNIAHSDNIIA